MKGSNLESTWENYIIKGAEIYTGDRLPFKGYVEVSGGKIVDVGQGDPEDESRVSSVVNLDGYKVIPGLIDLHIHGYLGCDVADCSWDTLLLLAQSLAEVGTTSFLPTLGAMPADCIEDVVTQVKKAMGIGGGGRAEILGLHLEGPFLNPEKRGAMREDYLLQPSLDLISKWFQLSEGTLNRVTLAPEIRGAREVISFLVEKGVIVAAGHTMATYEQTLDAISQGVRVANHTYNAMRGFHHRDPGIIGAVFSDSRIWAEVICDGVHVHPGAVTALLAAKGTEKTCLVSDAIAPSGLGPGLYNSLGSDIIVDEEGRACLADGTLGGSTSTLMDCVINVMRWTKEPLERVLPMATVNPSEISGVSHRKGTLTPGKDADFVVLDNCNEVVFTVVGGQGPQR